MIKLNSSWKIKILIKVFAFIILKIWYLFILVEKTLLQWVLVRKIANNSADIVNVCIYSRNIHLNSSCWLRMLLANLRRVILLIFTSPSILLAFIFGFLGQRKMLIMTKIFRLEACQSEKPKDINFHNSNKTGPWVRPVFKHLIPWK